MKTNPFKGIPETWQNQQAININSTALMSGSTYIWIFRDKHKYSGLSRMLYRQTISLVPNTEGYISFGVFLFCFCFCITEISYETTHCFHNELRFFSPSWNENIADADLAMASKSFCCLQSGSWCKWSCTTEAIPLAVGSGLFIISKNT